jgi:flavin-binding protein dodecin
VANESIYKVIEIVGTSDESWEAATRTAVETAGKTLRDLRIAEVKELDVTIEDGKVGRFRARLSVSFKYETGDALG